MKINLILLAAGNSRRFNGNKLLALYKGKPIYMHVVEKALNLEVNKIICVTPVSYTHLTLPTKA